ncbi:MAG: hypothetical protein R3A10_07190 [Caldilineaceae bacterium]
MADAIAPWPRAALIDPAVTRKVVSEFARLARRSRPVHRRGLAEPLSGAGKRGAGPGGVWSVQIVKLRTRSFWPRARSRTTSPPSSKIGVRDRTKPPSARELGLL